MDMVSKMKPKESQSFSDRSVRKALVFERVLKNDLEDKDVEH